MTSVPGESPDFDAEAYYSQHPKELLTLTLAELVALSEENEFDFIKLAAKHGHKGAQTYMMAGPQDEADEDDTPDSEDPAHDEALEKATEPVAQPPELPGLAWYDSSSHGKRRYYAGAKGSRGKPEWTYDKAEAIVIEHIDHVFLVRRICREFAYMKVKFNKSENC